MNTNDEIKMTDQLSIAHYDENGNIKDTVTFTGQVNIQLFDENGIEKDSRQINNLVVTSGKNFIASRMLGTTFAVMSHMAVGTGTTAAVVGDTTLQTELTRVGTPNFTAGAGSSPNIVQYVGTFGPGVGTGALTEAGIFNDMTAGTMLARTVFAVVNKAAGDTIVTTWNITAA